MNSIYFSKEKKFLQKFLDKLRCFSEEDLKNSEITLGAYITTYSRISFNLLLLIMILICAFLGIYCAGGREFREDEDFDIYHGCAIFAIFLIFIIYNFTNKSSEIIDKLYNIYVMIIDVYLGIIIYDANYRERSFVFYLRIIYYFFLTSTICLIYRYETKTKEVVMFLFYKFLVFLIFIFTNTHTFHYLNFICEFGFFFFWAISIFIYLQLRQDLCSRSAEFFCEQQYQNEYYQSLINMINKSFLSLNVSLFTLNFNDSFENFLKLVGLNQNDIECNLKSRKNSNTEKSNNNNHNNNININYNNNLNLNNTENNNTNINQGQKIELTTQNQVLLKTQKNKNSTIISKIDINLNNSNNNSSNRNSNINNLNNLINSNYNNNNEIINPSDDKKTNLTIQKISKQKILNEENKFSLNNSNNPMLNQEINKNLYLNVPNLQNNQINQEEDIFIKKLDYILNEVFVNFHEESSNKNSSSSPGRKLNPSQINKKSSMSEAIRDIFYSRSKLSLNDGFVLKGIFSTLPNFKTQLTIELYYRKIITYQGEVMEFYFNDITSTRKVESEKALNKVRSLVLAKISHEFKTPLLTIIYILKSYINNRNLRESFVNNSGSLLNISANLQQKNYRNNNGLSADDYIRNTIDLSDYMLSLINDIIDYSIINSEFDFKCEFEKFEFSEMLEFSFRILKILLACKGLNDSICPILEIDPKIPQFFCNDEKRIKQILLNFITNSIKFTKRGYIKLSAVLNEEGIKISVEDTGCGIESDKIQRLFSDIYSSTENVENNSKKITTGLGLSISKKIIEKIGNKIECSSIPNQITVFNIYISNKEDKENDIIFNENISNEINENLSFVEDRQIAKTGQINSFTTPVGISNNFKTNSFKYIEENSQMDKLKSFLNLNKKSTINNIKQIKTENLENLEMRKSSINTTREKNENIHNLVRQKTSIDLSPEKNESLRKNISVYDEEQTIIQSPRDIPMNLEEITNEKNYFLKDEKKKISKKENYELTLYIKPILRYFESDKSSIILYVDDSEILRKTISKQILSYIEDKDADVIVCKDGLEAFFLVYLDQLSRNKIKCIISDDKMNLMDGKELNEIIMEYSRKNKIRKIPFALCDDEMEDNEDLKKIEEEYYMVKKNPGKDEIMKFLEISNV